MPLFRAELRRRRGVLPPVLIHDLSQVLYLPFDHDDGDYARDRSGHVNHGTLTGCTRVAGKVAQALSFNGTTDYVEIADSPSVSLNVALTLMAWLYPISSIGVVKIIAKWGADNMCYFIGDSAGKLYGYIKANETHCSVDGVTTIPLDQWSHVAMTWDGAKLRSYFNAVFKKYATATGTIRDTTYPLCIGAQRGSAAAEMFFNGVIDEARVYNRALSQAEIRRVMNMRGI